MQVAETSTAPERQHRVYWWKEAIIVAAFYMVYSWTRNQFGSNKIAADGIPDQAFTNAVRVIRWETRAQPVPRTDGAELVPAVQVVHPVLEHVLRHDALHRHARRVHPAVRQAPRRVPAVAQHARGDDRAGDHRLRVLPVDATAPARRAVSGDRSVELRRGVHRDLRTARRRVGLRRHPRRLRRAVVVRLRHDGVDLEPVRGDAEHAHRVVDVVRGRRVAVAATSMDEGRWWCCTRWRRCSASSSPPTTSGSTASAGCSCSASVR